MLRLFARLSIVTLVIAASPQLISDIKVDSLGSALLAAAVYGVLFVVIGWLIRIGVVLLSIVPGLLTLGLFFLLVPVIANAILLKLTARMLSSFDIGSWRAAFLLSFALSVVNLLLDPKRRPVQRPD
jgi:putative membrane protein